ncbi:MAG: DUF2079 domain-containing protein, partial [Candidatus Omnitrophica bacterium]|nr:DUF2079 domain-containing protein [Candidatus Omnitrophota bacterium]
YGSVFFVPFCNPVGFLTAPIFLHNWLSENGVTRSMNYHYTTGLAPFLFVSTMVSLKKFRQSQKLRKFVPCLCAALAVTALLRAGAPEYFYYWQSAKRVNERTEMIRTQLAQIPSVDRVLSHNNLLAQVSNRRGLYQFDYNNAVTKTEQALHTKADRVVLDKLLWEPGTAPFEEELVQFLQGGYQPSFQEDGFVILTRRSAENAAGQGT